jgi:alkylation response protein AidB-like acyl-CoA dehydrogenase
MSYTPYHPHTEEWRFILQDVLCIEDLLAKSEGGISMDLVMAVLEEAGKFASEVLSPLNASGDREGAVWKAGNVTMPKGFKEAYGLFIQNGWNGVPFSPEFGGQGLPWVVSSAISEFWSGANMAFGLCPLLTQGSVELLTHYGTQAQKAAYLSKLVSGEWTGTMCLTEPEAGSDVGAVSTRAVPAGDAYHISGTKIFITYGEHDMTENIIHMVLARLPDAPEGSRGISLFLVPKILPDSARNQVECVSIEHKLGIHASPTAVLSFEGATGYLVGEPHKGLKAMFTMMNNARLGVGIEGVAIAESSVQQAKAYANERLQGKDGTGKPCVIAKHPDVKRMLLSMEARTKAIRTLMLYLAYQIDLARLTNDARTEALVQLLTPVVKAYATDTGFWVASEAVQVFGGMGYIEETGIAQNLRDARIAMIYEGTNGIQAQDLVMRKLNLDNGAPYRYFREAMESWCKDIPAPHQAYVRKALETLDNATKSMQQKVNDAPEEAAFEATDYLALFGKVACGCMMGRRLAVTQSEEEKELTGYYLQRL